MRNSFAPALVVYTDAGGVEREGHIIGTPTHQGFVTVERVEGDSVVRDIVKTDAFRLKY